MSAVQNARRLDPRDWWCAAVMGLLVVAAVFASQGPSVLSGRAFAPHRGVARVATAPLPQQAAPPVEPVQYADVTPEDAVKINAGVPFSTAPNPAARPFVLKGSPDELARATDCLAAAEYYEAGVQGDDGMRAVAQVVLNRLRHPAFPKTVCGVVFEGSERSTGCQFTFTCDGSLARIPSESGWRRARELAKAALNGKVYKPVGWATHYHTNWVVPYWSGSLDKIAAVDTHLFYRWSGWWGTPPAFRFSHEGSEPVVAKLAALSPAHAAADTQLAASGAGEATATQLADKGAKQVKIVSPGGDAFVVVLDRKVSPASYPSLALAACGTKDFCKFMGWTDPKKAPKGFPIEAEQHKALSFSYLRNRSNGFEKMLWNCHEFHRPDESQCMKS